MEALANIGDLVKATQFIGQSSGLLVSSSAYIFGKIYLLGFLITFPISFKVIIILHFKNISILIPRMDYHIIMGSRKYDILI